MSAPPQPKRQSPATIFVLVAAGVALGTLYGARRLSVAIWIGYLAGINLAAFLLYGYDKAVAGGTRLRVPESVLQGIAFFGGSPAAWLSQVLFRHKTVKQPFQRAFRLIVAAQILILGLALWVWIRPPGWLPEGLRRMFSAP